MRNSMNTMLGLLLAAASSLAGATTETYPGNGAGGPVGNGSLTISDSGNGVLNFSLAAGQHFLGGNVVVLFLDTKPGGPNDTTTFHDFSADLTSAISGSRANSLNNSVTGFPRGFGADYAIAVEPGVSGALYDLSNPSRFNLVADAHLSGSGIGPFTFDIRRSDAGLGPTDPFSFVGTLTDTDGALFNGTIGTSVYRLGSDGSADAGIAFSQADTFPVPEPASAALFVCVPALFLRRRRFAA